MATLKDVSQCILDGDMDQIKILVQQLIDDGTDPIAIINDCRYEYCGIII